jgi:hypothetical protein
MIDNAQDDADGGTCEDKAVIQPVRDFPDLEISIAGYDESYEDNDEDKGLSEHIKAQNHNLYKQFVLLLGNRKNKRGY